MPNNKEQTKATLQPRFLMGIATAILSLAIFAGPTGAALQSAQQDLTSLGRRALNYYEDLRLVYQLQRALEEPRKEEASVRHLELASISITPAQVHCALLMPAKSR
ncbi:MAG: hypothetical protein JO138_19890 [Acidobacteriaceae bacterium]|nr:hypothetical protein [Acidobacteriaceae bacterium]